MTPFSGCATLGKNKSEGSHHAAFDRTPFSHPAAAGWDARPARPHHRPGAGRPLYRNADPLPPAPGAVDLVHGLGPLPERFRRLCRWPLLQGSAQKRPAGDRLRHLTRISGPGLCHRSRPRRLPLGTGPARRGRRGG